MTVPALALSAAPPRDIAVDVLVIGVTKSDEGPVIATGDAELDALAAGLPAIGFAGAKDEVRRVPANGGAAAAIAFVGLGASDPDAAALRYAAGAAVRSITGVDSIALALPATSDDELQAVLEGAAIGGYSYSEYRSKVDPRSRPATTVTVVGSGTDDDAIVARATAVADAVGLVRDLVNAPPSDLYPETLAERAVSAAESLPVEVQVLSHDDLVAGGFGGILGVGQGSPRGPRLVKVVYSPASASAHLALVGKGITFDSGGLSLKPAASMVGMKYDMTGAATVLAVIVAAARLALPVRLTGWLCLAENMPSGHAIRPNDVLTIRGGTTVEVLNTDAEGRLVLADGIVAASEEHPDAVIDVATLTGAAIVAMGNRYTAVMGDAALVERVISVADYVDEPFWAMPLPAELRASLDSDVADIANAKIGSTAGGMLLAGVFLREFVGTADGGDSRIPWAHLDIAGSSNNSAGAYGFTGKGPTGVSVRTLLALVEDFGSA